MTVVQVLGDYFPGSGGVASVAYGMAHILSRSGIDNAIICGSGAALAGERVYTLPCLSVDAIGQARRDGTLKKALREVSAELELGVWIPHYFGLHLYALQEIAFQGIRPVHLVLHHLLCPTERWMEQRSVCPRTFGFGCAPFLISGKCSDARSTRSKLAGVRTVLALKSILQAVSQVLCLSDYVGMLVRDYVGREVQVLNPFEFVDTVDTEPLHDTAGRMLFVGRLVAHKGIDVFVRAMQYCPAFATVIGDGPARVSAIRLADELGLGSRIKFTGSANPHAVRLAMRESGALAFPSLAGEGLGLVVAEARSLGLPVVGADTPWMAEWQQMVNGIDIVDHYADPSTVGQVYSQALTKRPVPCRIRDTVLGRPTVLASLTP